MNRVGIDLENCYGIKKFNIELDFCKDDPIYAIYAPNGMMKSSLAQTFQDISEGVPSVDRIFPTRQTKRKIVDELGRDLLKDNILVVRPYDSDFGHPQRSSTLLVDPKLRKEYEQLHEGIGKAKDTLLKALKKQSKSKKDFDKEFSDAFASPDFATAIGRIDKELTEQQDTPFADVEYDKIFDERVLAFLQSTNVTHATMSFSPHLHISRKEPLIITTVLR